MIAGLLQPLGVTLNIPDEQLSEVEMVETHCIAIHSLQICGKSYWKNEELSICGMLTNFKDVLIMIFIR